MHTVELISKDYQLNQTEEVVLEYIINHIEEIYYLSARELAKRTYTNPMTITRLAKKLHFSGYNDFKYHIVHFINIYSINNEDVNKDDQLLSLMNKVSDIEKKVINETQNNIKIKELEEIIQLLSQTQYIDIYANDANSDLAKYASHNFASVGKIVNIYDEVDQQILHCVNAPKDHFIIFISKLSDNKILKECLIQFNKRSITTLYITSHKVNSLVTTYQINTVYNSNALLGNIVFHISLKYILDLLYILLLSSDYQNAQELSQIHHELYTK